MSVKELDSIIALLAEKKRNIEQQESETNMQILLVFLHCLRKQKMNELNEVSFFSVCFFTFICAFIFKTFCTCCMGRNYICTILSYKENIFICICWLLYTSPLCLVQ